VRKAVYLLIAGLLISGCGWGKAAASKPISKEDSSFRLRTVLPPSAPIDEAIKVALASKNAAGKSKPGQWNLGPDLTAGQKLSTPLQQAQRSMQFETPRAETPVKRPAPPQSTAQIPGIREVVIPEQPEQEKPFSPSEAYTGYRLAVGDIVDIVVSGDPDLSGRAVVRQDGRIALPGVLVLVKAAGRKLEELTEDIRTSLYGTYLKQLPKISVDVVEGPDFSVTGIAGDRIFVRIPLTGENKTLKSILIILLAKAGGKDDLDLANVAVIEPTGSYTVNARTVMERSGASDYVPPGTVIIIPMVQSQQESPAAKPAAQSTAAASKQTAQGGEKGVR